MNKYLDSLDDICYRSCATEDTIQKYRAEFIVHYAFRLANYGRHIVPLIEEYSAFEIN